MANDNGASPDSNELPDMVAIGAVIQQFMPGDLLMLRNIPTATAEVETEPPAPSSCPICQGAKYYTLPVPFGHPDFGVLFPCACKKAEWEARKSEKLLHLSNLDAFRELTFDNFNQKVKSVRRAFLQAQDYAGQLNGWLSFFGGYGVGKTHLAAAIANEALGRKVPVIFVVVPDFLDHLRATFAPNSEDTYDERFELFRNVQLLVLDDLGTENTTPWAREKLYQLVNHRYNARLPTVFTTNQSSSQIDGRIVSRMCDPCVNAEIILIDAADYRRRNMKEFRF